MAIGYAMHTHYNECEDIEYGCELWQIKDVQVHYDNNAKKLMIKHEKTNFQTVEDILLWFNTNNIRKSEEFNEFFDELNEIGLEELEFRKNS